MLRHMAHRLAQDGHTVMVLGTQPSYDASGRIPAQPPYEKMDGFVVRRIRLIGGERSSPSRRVLNALLFSLRIAAEIIFNRYDVVMAATAPPVVTAAVAARMARLRGSRFIYHCQDIHPESGGVAGLIKNKVLFRLMLLLDEKTCNIANRIVVLSDDMADSLVSRGLNDKTKIRVINNFMLGDETGVVSPVPSSRDGIDVRPFRIIFAGNMGRFQGLESVIDAMFRLEQSFEVELLFVGEGVAKSSLVERAGALNGNRVLFMPYQPQEKVEKLISESDMGLIALQKDVYKVAYPSKTATYMKLGCPLLICMEPESELARFTIREDIGIVIRQPDSPESIALAIREAYKRRGELADKHARIAELGAIEFGRRPVLEKWSKLMRELEAQGAR